MCTFPYIRPKRRLRVVGCVKHAHPIRTSKFQFYTPSGQLNTTDYGCPELDDMYVRSLTEEYRFDQEKLINLTMEMDELFMDEMLAVPLTQVVGRTMISERIILAVDEYDPFLGYALMYADIDLTK